MMKMNWRWAFVLILFTRCAFAWGQAGTQAVETTLCDLYQHPEQYASKMVKVRGTIAGNDMWIDAFTTKSCSSWMSIVVVFPDQVTPRPDFNLVHDASLEEFKDAMHRAHVHIDSTFEGRFDSVVTVQDGKRVRSGKGYGKHHRHDGRIVLYKVSDVVVKSVSRK